MIPARVRATGHRGGLDVDPHAQLAVDGVGPHRDTQAFGDQTRFGGGAVVWIEHGGGRDASAERMPRLQPMHLKRPEVVIGREDITALGAEVAKQDLAALDCRP